MALAASAASDAPGRAAAINSLGTQCLSAEQVFKSLAPKVLELLNPDGASWVAKVSGCSLFL